MIYSNLLHVVMFSELTQEDPGSKGHSCPHFARDEYLANGSMAQGEVPSINATLAPLAVSPLVALV